MKELEARIQMNRQELTGNFNPSTLDVRGNIFMPDGSGRGELPSVNIEQPEATSTSKQESPTATSEEAKRLWEKFSGKKLKDIKDPDEKQTIELAIEKGTVPQLAGASDIGPDDNKTNESVVSSQGGDEPPNKPPTSTESSNDSSNDGDNSSEINIDKSKITDGKILKYIRGVEAGYSQGSTLDERLSSLKESCQKIILDDVDEEQRNIALGALQEHIDILKSQKDARLGAEAEAKELSQKERMEATNQAEKMKETIENTSLSYVQKLELIENMINNLDPNDRIYPHVIAMAIKEIEIRDFDHIIEDTLEYSLERYLNRADASPLEEYPQFTFAETENIAILTHTARRFDEIRKRSGMDLGITPGRREMFNYLGNLANRRKVMHELFRSMNDLESYTGLVTRALRKSGMSFVEKQLVGVSQVQIDYDQVLLALKSFKPQEQGWLLEEDFELGDQMVKDKFQKLAVSHTDYVNKRFIRNDGTELGTTESRPLRQWEIDRAFIMGRDLNAASQRRVLYGILGDVPENVDDLLKSVAHEPIARRLAPLKLIPDRFFSHPIAKRFIEIFKSEKNRDSKTGKINNMKYGYEKEVDGVKNLVGYYGSSQDAMAILDAGITDPKSNSWRSRLMFLKNPDFLTRRLGNRDVTIGDYLDAIHASYSGGLKGQKKRDALERWAQSPEVTNAISDQRLFLGVLLNYPDIGKANKTEIWKKVASLMPSRIASLLPNETLDVINRSFDLEGNRDAAVEKWKSISSKLWIAENLRVANDARVLSGEQGELHDLEYYFEIVDLTDLDEIDVIRQIQDLGNSHASTFSEATFPFTPFLDDAPVTDWDKLSEFDFTRILVSDQNAFQEGYGHIMGLFDNPAQKSEAVVKLLHDAFGKIITPIGREHGQKLFGPIIIATLKLRQMSSFARIFGTTLSRAFRIPTSPIEEFNLSAHVSDDEIERAGILRACAQLEMLNDDSNEAINGKTQYMRAKKELDADQLKILLAYARILIQLLGPAFGMEFLRAMGLKLDQPQ